MGVRPGPGPRTGGFIRRSRVQMVGRASFLAHHIKKSPYHLNMMRVTVIDKPSSEERVMVTHEGKEACCYVQGNAWGSPSCEDISRSGAAHPAQTAKTGSTKRPM